MLNPSIRWDDNNETMDVFSHLMMIGECLLDGRRTRAFGRAIERTVRPTDVVLDVGTGSGVLAMFSARAGAKHVYAIDISPDIVAFAKKNVARNALSQRITVKQGDAKSAVLPKGVDVVSMELMDTWLVSEQQAVVLNALRRRGVIAPHTRLIPYKYDCLAALVTYDFSFYGFTMPFVIQARNFGAMQKITHRLSPVVEALSLELTKPIKTSVSLDMEFPILTTGTANALLLTATTHLMPGRSIGPTSDMNMPVVVPIAPRRVRAGSSVSLSISYRMGAGFSQFSAE